MAKELGWRDCSASDLPANESYPVVDICKFIFAFFVVMIHVSPLASYDSAFANQASFVLRQSICRIADPFYFTAAGFLLFRKIDLKRIESEGIRKYVFKILRLYGMWSLILLVGGGGQLWFLGGLVVAVFFLFVLLKCKISLRLIGAISLAFFLVGVADVSFGGTVFAFLPSFVSRLYDGLNSTVKLGFIMGVPYVFLGLLFAKKRIVMSKPAAISGFLLSLALLIGESYALKMFGTPKDYYQLVMLYPLTFFLFFIVTHLQIENMPKYKDLRIVGMMIYYSHLFLHSVVRAIYGVLSKSGGVIGLIAADSLVQFLTTVLLAVILGELIARFSKKNKYSFLHYLYS